MKISTPALLAILTAFAALGYSQALKVENTANPAPNGSMEPHWSTTFDGNLLLSWIEPAKNDAYAMRYAIRRGGQWSEPRTVVTDRRFFRQPAEAPSMVSFPGGALLAEWVEVPNDSSEAEYIYVSASKDGVQWTTPVMANQDRNPVQHALVSMAASGDQEASLIWLEALKGEDAPSRLMRALVSSAGKVIKEEILEPDVCTCCPTSIVRTSRGLLVAYRGHTPQEIRDIAVKRFENGRWAPAKVLNPDRWKINACPVNGPAVAANGDQVAIAWYTEANDKPRVQVIFSSDAGNTFSKPVTVSTDSALGHASAALTEGGVLVSWLEAGDKSSEVRVRFVSTAGVPGSPLRVATGSQQSLGYPRLVRSGQEIWITWGNSQRGKVQTARLSR